MRCDTTSGRNQCDREHGHDGECETDTNAYVERRISGSESRALRTFTNLRHVEEAARSLVRCQHGSERYEEKLSDLITALGELE